MRRTTAAVTVLATCWTVGTAGTQPALATDPAAHARGDDSALSIVWEEDDAGAVNGRLSVRGDLASLAATMALEDSRIGGTADIDFVVAGTASEPSVAGRGRVVGGVYEHLVAGTLLRDLVIDASSKGARYVALGLRGNDGAAGSVRGNARVTLRPDDKLGIEGTLDFSKTLLVRRDDITVTASGQVDYSGTLRTGLISGRLEASRVLVRLADAPPPAVAALEVVEVGPRWFGVEAPDDGDQADGDIEGSWIGTLDLLVKMPRNVFVRGRGLDSEWWGLVRITGTTVAPKLLGQLQLTEGKFLFAGREFILREGTMEFTGIERMDPLVEWSARSQLPEVTAILEVAGWSSRPAVTLTSEPKLPQDEILARIMFEKSVSRLTSGEALRLAEALKMLAQGESPVVGIAAFTDRMLGVDVLALERQRRLAGDIRPRRAREGGRWDEEQLGAKTMEIEITPNISVAGESDDEDDALERSKLGVIWKWDY